MGVLNINIIMLIVVNIILFVVVGGLVVLVFDWIIENKCKFNLLVILNGILGGLVGIIVGCDIVSNWLAIVIGVVVGILLVLGIKLLDCLCIDDGVGVWFVYGLCGIWGGIVVGIFSINVEYKFSV